MRTLSETTLNLAGGSVSRGIQPIDRSVLFPVQPPRPPAKFRKPAPAADKAPSIAPELLPESVPAKVEAAIDCGDIYGLYLKEVGKVPLLSQKEEIELAYRVKLGDAAAREQMITANLRLVIKIARQFESYGLPLLDLISEGNIGLMRAVDRFDPSKGARLASYAAFWIKQFVRRAVANQAKTIRLPVHLVDELARMRQAANRLYEELGRQPSDEELSDEMNLPLAKIAKLRAAVHHVTSLDSSVDEHGENTVGERIADERATSPAEELESNNQLELLAEAMKGLSPREIDVLRGRFGLGDAVEETLEEIGKRSAVTRERIRQIQNSALGKLRRRMEQSLRRGTSKSREETQ